MMKKKSKKILFYNAAKDGVARTVLASCYKLGVKSFMRQIGPTMTTVIEIEEDEENEIDDKEKQVSDVEGE